MTGPAYQPKPGDYVHQVPIGLDLWSDPPIQEQVWDVALDAARRGAESVGLAWPPDVIQRHWAQHYGVACGREEAQVVIVQAIWRAP